MLDIGWTELLLIAVVAIVVIGRKDLPRAMRVVGQWTGKLKKIAREFQGQFNDALREAELESVQRDLQEVGKIDPVADVRKQMSSTADDIRKGLDKPAQPPPASSQSPMCWLPVSTTSAGAGGGASSSAAPSTAARSGVTAPAPWCAAGGARSRDCRRCRWSPSPRPRKPAARRRRGCAWRACRRRWRKTRPAAPAG